MTGKQLKQWASTIPDDSEIQLKGEYGSHWDPLEAKRVRAMLISSPPTTMDDVCNLEDAERAG
jgi:hypothetical protein